jgi:hypothetical protein
MDARKNAKATSQEEKPCTDQRKSGNGKTNKFPEPTAWALNWETMHRDQLANQSSGRFTSEQELRASNGKVDKFPQPWGWALKWDGYSIAALEDSACADTSSSDADSQQNGSPS